MGSYIGLNVLVPKYQAELAAPLLEEYENTDLAEGSPEFRGPFRDEFEDPDEEDADDWKASAALADAIRKARLAALILPFGGG